MNLIAEVVINYLWLINDNKTFNWEKCEHGIWDEWEVLKL